MPLYFENIHEYDGRASVSSFGGLRCQNSPSIKSEDSDDSTESSTYEASTEVDLDVSVEDSKPVKDEEIIDIEEPVSEPDTMYSNPIQYLSSLPYTSRRSEGRAAVRQSSRDRSRSRHFERQSTTDSISSYNSLVTVPSESGCTCPVSYHCLSRESGNLLDCRTLVVEWKKFHERTNEEAYNIIAATPPENAPFVKEDRVRELSRYLIHFKTLNPHSRDALNKTVERVWSWYTEIRSCNITDQVLQASQVINTLDTFLADDATPTRNERQFPKRLEENLTILLRKWKRGDLICDLNRGLIQNITHDQNGLPLRVKYLLDTKWKYYIHANFYGEGHLVNGQEFYSRLHLMRDGAHSARIAGISGTVEKGARSIVMGYHDIYKKEFYADIDMGNTIEYMGTALKDTNDAGPTNMPDDEMETRRFDGDDNREPTACTQMMMTSLRTGTPIRVIRSPRLAKQVKNKPSKCFRYDGLYKVVKMKPLKLDRQIWSFRLERIPGQGPLRGFDTEEQPPSHGERPGYRRYNRNKYGGGQQTSSRSRRSRSPSGR